MTLSYSGLAHSDPILMLRCTLCPRNCRADRTNGKYGYCRAGSGYEIASICIHHGEEPPVSGQSGICNVFFYRCNLQCTYCQNCQISSNKPDLNIVSWQLEDIVFQIKGILNSGVKTLGFVSPSHMVPQMISIIKVLRSEGENPVIVYNSNAYEKVEVLKELEEYVDVYLPDFKYIDPELSLMLSDAADYPEVAVRALREMYRQKGSTLLLDNEGYAISGMIIRHLILPGQLANSEGVLRHIAHELSTKLHISLMAQYYPMPAVASHPTLGKPLAEEEYNQVVDVFNHLGFERGWIQEIESNHNYLPDFCAAEPFKNNHI